MGLERLHTEQNFRWTRDIEQRVHDGSLRLEHVTSLDCSSTVFMPVDAGASDLILDLHTLDRGTLGE